MEGLQQVRAVTFAAVTRLRTSRTVAYLSTRLSAGVMVILVAYCLRALPQTHPMRMLAALFALTVTIGLHLWRRNGLLSIMGGTLVNVALASTVVQ